MKPFNLEEHLKNPSRKVVTRDGRKVTRFLCTDAKGDYPIVALVENFSSNEMPISYTKDGEYRIGDKSDGDLFFAPKKTEGWINIYSNSTTGAIYDSEEEARKMADSHCIATIKIEWEE